MSSRLLKFSVPSDYAFRNLASGQIFCQHHAAYNDPFEFWTSILGGIPDPDSEPERYLSALRAWGFHFRTVAEALAEPLVQDHVDEYFEECELYVPHFEALRQQVRISCFSSEADNLLMWSHYGDGLRGFCIAFDEDLVLPGDQSGYVLDVAYHDTPPQVDSFIYGVAWDQDWFSNVAIEETKVEIEYQGKTERQADIKMYEQSGKEALQTMREIWQHVFATKPAEWMYERERRLLVQTDKADETPILLSYPPDAIKEVIFGERMPEDYKSRLLALMRDRYPHANVKTARRSHGAYTLTIA